MQHDAFWSNVSWWSHAVTSTLPLLSQWKWQYVVKVTSLNCFRVQLLLQIQFQHRSYQALWRKTQQTPKEFKNVRWSCTNKRKRASSLVMRKNGSSATCSSILILDLASNYSLQNKGALPHWLLLAIPSNWRWAAVIQQDLATTWHCFLVSGLWGVPSSRNLCIHPLLVSDLQAKKLVTRAMHNDLLRSMLIADYKQQQWTLEPWLRLFTNMKHSLRHLQSWYLTCLL